MITAIIGVVGFMMLTFITLCVYIPGKTTRVYLSGPITGNEEEAERKFSTLKMEIENYAHNNYFRVKVINPFEIKSKDNSWYEHMRVDLRKLLTCEVMYLTSDVKCYLSTSKGVQTEIDLAETVGIHIACSLEDLGEMVRAL